MFPNNSFSIGSNSITNFNNFPTPSTEILLEDSHTYVQSLIDLMENNPKKFQQIETDMSQRCDITNDQKAGFYFCLAKAYIRTEKYDPAKQAISEGFQHCDSVMMCIQMHRLSIKVKTLTGNVRLAQRRLATGLEFCNFLDPSSKQSAACSLYKTICSTLFRETNEYRMVIDKAMECLQNYEVDETNTIVFLYLIAKSHHYLREYENSIRALDCSMENFPGKLDAQFFLLKATNLFNQARYSEAKQTLRSISCENLTVAEKKEANRLSGFLETVRNHDDFAPAMW